MMGAGCGDDEPDSALSRQGHVRSAWVGSAAGGGWTSHDPTPGGAMEGGLW
jgi:hypothetical protein